ncbi:MAG: type II secretion system F family protein [Candidatus Diapherotrites archaeon]|nr:type II secretion system F family protein [Candidatus Diapherotrites archaeon]
MYERFGELFPKPMQRLYEQMLLHSDVELDEKRLLGFVLLMSIAVGVMVSIYSNIFFYTNHAIMFVVGFALSEAFFFLWLSFSADAKARRVDRMLPDALSLVAANIRSGLTIDKALVLANRPEFGPLQQELQRMGKEVLTGSDLKDALKGMQERVRSLTLARTIELMVHGIESGAELADLLEETGEDLRSQEMVQREVRSNVFMYAILIFIAAAFGAPLLFGVSTYLSQMLSSFIGFTSTRSIAGSALSISLAQSSISSDFVFLFALVSLFASSISSAMIIGVLTTGKEKEGLRYVPVLLVVTYAVFLLTRYVTENFFGNMLPI